MNIRSARASALVLAAITMGVAGCDSVQTTQPLKSAQPALAVPHSGSNDVVSQTYMSGSNVTAWDPIIPAVGDPNWPTSICTNNPAVGPNANWQNPHNAYVLYGHPWAGDYFYAPWINAYNSLGSIGPLGQSWTKYQTTVSGNGSFVIRLLADNCSWVYLDGTLVGVQGTDLSKNSYGLTLNGTHTLTFVIFDGGGANGGKFLLETTTNPPPPLNPDLDGDGHINTEDAFPLDPTRWSVDATAPVITHNIVGDAGANGWYTSDVGVTWSVVDNESGATKSGCDDLTLSANQTEQTYICNATSAGGTAADTVKIKIDKTHPTVTGAVTSGTLGTNGWYVSDVGVTWTPSAAGPSGQTLSSSCSNTSLTANSAGYTFNCSVTTGAGVSSAPATITVKRDATNPTIGYSGNAGVYALDQNVSIVCSYGDAMSGVAMQSCANINGVAYTFGLGAHAYSASVTDNAGNTNSAATTFTVRATPGSLCTMTRQFVTGPGELGVENSLCGKLGRGDYAPYINEVQAQSGKKISAANASLLILWAQSL